jgi:hypothetical protein
MSKGTACAVQFMSVCCRQVVWSGKRGSEVLSLHGVGTLRHACRMFTCDTGSNLNRVTHFYHYKVSHSLTQDRQSGTPGWGGGGEGAIDSKVLLSTGAALLQSRNAQGG